MMVTRKKKYVPSSGHKFWISKKINYKSPTFFGPKSREPESKRPTFGAADVGQVRDRPLGNLVQRLRKAQWHIPLPNDYPLYKKMVMKHVTKSTTSHETPE